MPSSGRSSHSRPSRTALPAGSLRRRRRPSPRPSAVSAIGTIATVGSATPLSRSTHSSATAFAKRRAIGATGYCARWREIRRSSRSCTGSTASGASPKRRFRGSRVTKARSRCAPATPRSARPSSTCTAKSSTRCTNPLCTIWIPSPRRGTCSALCWSTSRRARRSPTKGFGRSGAPRGNSLTPRSWRGWRSIAASSSWNGSASRALWSDGARSGAASTARCVAMPSTRRWLFRSVLRVEAPRREPPHHPSGGLPSRIGRARPRDRSRHRRAPPRRGIRASL